MKHSFKQVRNLDYIKINTSEMKYLKRIRKKEERQHTKYKLLEKVSKWSRYWKKQGGKKRKMVW